MQGPLRNFLKSQAIDIAIGNEAYEVDIPLIVRLLRPRRPFVINFFDFVATDPMTVNPLERLGAWCLNALWSLTPACTRATRTRRSSSEDRRCPREGLGAGAWR